MNYDPIKVLGDDPVLTTKNDGQIVIVDDNPENLRALKVILEERGYVVRAAISGKLALSAINEARPDLILLDIMMPEMDGYEVCQQLKSMPGTRDIPVLFISALDGTTDKIRAFEVGGLDYISKPFYSEEVIARVRTHISLSRAQHKLEEAYDSLKDHADKLENANNELAAFSYSVSHDLRAPLRAIGGFSQILAEDYADVVDENGKDCLQRISSGVNKMGRLIEDILQLSKLSTAELVRHKVDMSSLAKDVVRKLCEQNSDRQVQVSIASDMQSCSDGLLITILLTNVIGNAWKYTQKTDSPTIEIGVEKKGHEKIFFVRDNGAGFDMKYADGIFKPFKRLHSEAEYEGTGIGLATVQRIIKLHGGRVWVESEINKGTTIYFVLE